MVEDMKIAVFGSGKFGKYITNTLPKEVDFEIICFVDNAVKKNNTFIMGKKVISPNDLKDLYLCNEIDTVLIGMLDIKNITSVIQQLNDLGIKQIGVIRGGISIGDDISWSKVYWQNRGAKPILPYLETNIIDSCNLKCTGCTHFSNLFSGNTEIDLNVFEKDLQKIAKSLEVLNFRLLGGEPLLNKNLMQYICISRAILPNTHICLVTNGLLFLQQEDKLFQCLKEKDIQVDITVYPPTKKKLSKIVELLNFHEIKYSLSEEVSYFYRTLNLEGSSDFVKAFGKCMQKHCHFFRNGKLYTCPYEALLKKYAEYFCLEEMLLDISDLGIDIYDKGLNWQEVVSNLNKPILLCKYCSEQGGEHFSWGVSSAPKQDEWLVQTK